MGGDALALALAAAAVHAVWNVLIARDAERTHGAAAVALLAGALACTPLALASWKVSSGALGWAAASVALELGYIGALAAAYARGPVSFVYPVARGLAPAFVLALAPSLDALPGVLAVAAGVALLAAGRPDRRTVALTLAVAACVAGYTLVDDRGLRHADAVPYLWLVLAPTALLYAAAVGPRRVREAVGAGPLLAGLGMFGAYGLTLAALDLADPAPVAAVRESSVVIGTLLAGAVLGERVGVRGVIGAVAVAAGIAMFV